MNGLTPQIAYEVDLSNPKTLDEAMSKAQLADLRAANRRRTHPFGRAPFESRRVAVGDTLHRLRMARSASQAVPMELGNINSDEHGSVCGDEWGVDESKDGHAAGGQLSAFSHRAGQQRSSAPSQRPAPPKMTAEERERCMKEGLCFRCRRSGHRSIHCPVFLWLGKRAGPVERDRNALLLGRSTHVLPTPNPNLVSMSIIN